MKRALAIIMSLAMLLAIAPSFTFAVTDWNALLNAEGSNVEFTVDGWEEDADEGAAVSANHEDGSTSTIRATVTVSEGDVMLVDVKTSSEEGYDQLIFSVDGIEVMAWSGETSWTTYAYTFEVEGRYEIELAYVKDGSMEAGSDCAWVKEIYVGENTFTLEAISAPQRIVLRVGETEEVEYAPVPEIADIGDVEMSIEDTGIATVSNGVVTGVAEGMTQLTISSGDIEATVDIMVVEELMAHAFLLYDENAKDTTGLCKVDFLTGEIEMLLETPENVYGAEYVNGYYYAITGTNQMYIIDTNTLTIEDTLDIDILPNDVAYDYQTALLFAVVGNESNGSLSDLVYIDIVTGDTYVVATLDHYAMTFAITEGGYAYTIGYDGIVRRIDLETGETVENVGSVGIVPAYVQTMAFDHENAEQLYWLGIERGTDRCFTAHVPYGGEAITLYEFDRVVEFAGLSFMQDIEVADTTPVTGVSLSEDEIEIILGGKEKLTATVTPDDATNRYVLWSSSDESVATVKDGVVTAVGNGTATITATTIDGGFTDTCEVTVTGVPVYILQEDFEDALEGWTILDEDGDSYGWMFKSEYSSQGSSHEGEDMFVSQSYLNESHTALDPDNWLISPEFTISEDSKSAQLSFMAASWDGSYPDTLAVYIGEGDAEPETFTTKLFEEVLSDTAETISIDISEYAGKTVRVAFRHYNSYDCFMLGLDMIQVRSVVPETPVTGITIDPTTATVEWGETLTINATIDPADATNKAIEWTTSDPHVATVVDGVVTPVSDGTATITATTVDGGFTATCEVTVIDSPTYFIYEDFEDELEGWTLLDEDGDGFGWMQAIDTEISSYEGTGVMVSLSYDNQSGAALTPDNWMISPMFTADEETVLSWYEMGQDANYATERYSVYVLPADYTDLSQAIEVYNGVSTDEWLNKTVDLSEYAGQDLRVAFRHHNISNMFMLNIDLVTVAGMAEQTYTVTFVDHDGTVIEEQEVAEGEAATAPADPTREGYVFVGWDKEFSNVTEDMTVTAVYIEIGDVNKDGVINTGDAVAILKYVAEMITLDEVQFAAADMNADGTVNTGDAVEVLRYVVADQPDPEPDPEPVG